MENFTVLLTVLSAIALAAILYQEQQRRRHRKFPPGPKPWPIIGNIHLMGPARHRDLHALSQKYGEIMQLKFGDVPVVVASSPQMAKQIFKDHDANFASRPLLACAQYISYNYSNVLWAPNGPYWKQARKIYLTEVFSAKRVQFFQPIKVQESYRFYSHLSSFSGKPIVLRNHLGRYTLSIISRIVWGDDFFAEMTEQENSSYKLEELHELISEWTELNGVINMGDWIRWMRFLDLQGCVKKMKKLCEKFDRFHDHVIDGHLARLAAQKDEIAPRDVLESFLLLAQDKANSLEIKLTRDSIKGLIEDLLAGGTDTTVGVIEWCIQELMRHPHVMKKAKEEVERLVGGSKWVEESDLPQLPYINAIIMEAMRLHPLSPLLPPHYAINDCRVAGYDIRKGTVAIVNTFSLGMDPNTWDSPEEFLPERFMGKEVDLMGGNFALLPFGSGRRGCPGYKMGLKTAGMTVSNLLHGFELKLVEGMKPQDICMDEVYGLIQYPKHPLPIIMEPTLPRHLYEI